MQGHFFSNHKVMNSKTVEQGNYGVIIEGENKGKAFIKVKGEIKFIPFDALPSVLQEQFKKLK